jgi:tetratricopeptide (TPR) repeat protein
MAVSELRTQAPERASSPEQPAHGGPPGFVPSLVQAQAHYDAGRYLTAHQLLSTAYGAMETWQGTELRVLAGRLSNQLGAPRKGCAFHFYAHRRDPEHAEAAYFHLSSCLGGRGPYGMLLAAERLLDRVGLPDITRAHVLATKAHCLASFRDHERAFAILDEADRLAANDAWLLLQRSQLLFRADRLDEALALADAALVSRPRYVFALRQRAVLLAELSRMEEAVALLSESADQLEAGGLVWQLGSLEAQLGRHTDAERSFARAFSLMPLLEPGGRASLLAERADAAYMSERYPLARELAEQVGTTYYKGFAERLAAGQDRSGRRCLEVPWVRQKHMTCAPATLASIARYFELAVDHDELAREICYGGTHHHGERQWAERQGFAAREFTVTQEALQALIDRGVPIALTTVEPTSAHLQAIHGYDRTRGTLLVRDPSLRFDAEYDARAFFERYRASGPRGMVFLPAAQVHRLDGLVLPDEERYARVSELRRALENNDRAAAENARDELVALGADHRLALEARLSLARYTRDRALAIAMLERLIETFPTAQHWILQLAEALQNLAPLAEQEACLDRALSGSSAHPAIVRARAELIENDVRRQAEARFWLRKAVRQAPHDSLSTLALANHFWVGGRNDDAVVLYRFATCSEDTNEHYAASYFRAARLTGHVEEGLGFLRARVERYAQRSPRPVETLFGAYQILDRDAEAFELLEGALSRHSDGPLALFAADAFARRGEFVRAQTLVDSARGRVSEGMLLRASARVASLQGDAGRAHQLLRELAERDPLDLWAQEQLASVLAESQGHEAAAAHFVALSERFPHHYEVGTTRLGWAKRCSSAHAEQALDHLSSLAPHDGWVQRERAFWLARQKRLDEALVLAQEQVELTPTLPAAWGLLGLIHAGRLARDEAKAAHRTALERDPDYVFSLESLMDLSANAGERRAELERLLAGLEREVTDGTGLLRFAQFARGVFAPERLLQVLESALLARPDLPAAYLALIREHTASGRLSEAQAMTVRACERFAYRSDVWLERASVCALQGDSEGRLAALERAHQVEPDNADTARELAEELFSRRRIADARALCEACLRRHPTHAPLRMLLAQALYAAAERERAYGELERLCLFEPGYDRAWQLLAAWDEEVGRPDAALATARKLTEKRPDEARSWLVLARRLADTDDRAALEETVARATALQPELVDAYDLLAEYHAQRGAWAKALEACDPPAMRAAPSYLLRGRRAWVLAQRGSLRDAIAELDALLEQVPDYYTGARWLCDFYEQVGDAQAHARAARKLAQLAPDSAPTQGYVAAALAGVDDRTGAKEHFWRALALDPAYTYGALNAFDLHFDDAELEQAERALNLLEASRPEITATCLRAVRLHAVRARPAPLLEAFARLLRLERVDLDGVRAAQQAAEQHGFGAHIAQAYREALADEQANPQALEAWVHSALTKRPLEELRKALHSPLAPPGASAVSTLVTRLGDGAAVHRYRLGWFLWVHRAALRAQTSIWAAVGYALVSGGAYRRCAAWLRDYAGRTELEPWQLFNLALSLRRLGRDRQAGEAHRAALALTADHTTTRHRVWAALYAALSGQLGDAATQLQTADLTEIAGEDRFAHACTQLVLAAHALRAQGAYRNLAPLRFALARSIELAQVDFDQNAELASLFGRVLRRVAATRPLWQRLWMRFTWVRP